MAPTLTNITKYFSIYKASLEVTKTKIELSRFNRLNCWSNNFRDFQESQNYMGAVISRLRYWLRPFHLDSWRSTFTKYDMQLAQRRRRCNAPTYCHELRGYFVSWSAKPRTVNANAMGSRVVNINEWIFSSRLRLASLACAVRGTYPRTGDFDAEITAAPCITHVLLQRATVTRICSISSGVESFQLLFLTVCSFCEADSNVIG